VTQTATITVGAAAASASSSDVVVNVGTFSGKLVVYALNAAGSEVSYKIAGKWVTQVVTSDRLMRYDRVVGATGATIKVDIYVDGVLKVSKSVVTK
jgi:ribose 5-phosphate isomerase